MEEKYQKHFASMPSESTPLLQQVPVEEQPPRYSHHKLRKWCTIGLVIVPLLTFAIIAIVVVIGGDNDLLGEHGPHRSVGDDFPYLAANGVPHADWPQSHGISYHKLKDTLLKTPDAKRLREWSKYYTSGPHLAGKNISQAEWTRDRWLEWGVPQADLVSYDVYINYPKDARIALLKDDKVEFEASLEEDVLEEDPTSGLEDRVPVFHGYSANGNVTAQYVFVNYGTVLDFQDLIDAGIELKGKIALAKYGGIFRGLKVKRASELGMVGTIIYTDPGDDGEITEENGYKAYPDGPARHPNSVQRGSVQYLSVAPGDPTTPGYPSKPGAPREGLEGKIPDIPSVPISYKEALPLLKALNGHGPKASNFDSSHWHTGGLGYKGVKYNIGPSPPEYTINLVNEQEYVTNPLWNVIGIINGTSPDEVLVVGNHRDAWIAGGAGDPNSGSAVLNEVIRGYGKALNVGWKPLRTIVFASWDGEEYGLIGSTEWVEEYLPWLSKANVAYVNVDVGTAGPNFKTSAAPLLNTAIREITALVQSPNQTVSGQTISDVWDGHISTMGSGSDFTAFQDFAGISSIDLGFAGGSKDPVYHYHSNYDSFAWMEKYGDPDFKYHVAMSQIIGLLTAKLADEPLIAFNATEYGFGLKKYVQSVKDLADATVDFPKDATSLLSPLDAAVANFTRVASDFDASTASLLSSSSTSSHSTSHSALKTLYSKVHRANTAYKNLERAFLYTPGLDSRPWFKHVVFAPGLWTGYAGATFPGLVEAVEAGDTEGVRKWVGIIVECVERAEGVLKEGGA